MLDYIFIGIGVLIFLIFLFSIEVIHVRTLLDDLNIRWYNLAEKLQYRQDLLPLLVETVRNHGDVEEFKKYSDILIEVRSRASINNNPGMKKIVVEHDLSKRIEDLVYFGGSITEIKKNTTFLEVTKELKDIRQEIEKLSNDYNKKVRHHNKIVSRIWNRLPALMLKYGKKRIFEFE